MSRTSIILILGLVLLASALGLNVWFNSDVPDLNGENASSTEESVSSSNQDASSQQNVPSPGTIPAPVTMPDGSVQSDTETSQSEDAQSKAPDFDVVRISKDGDTVIAGRAPSGSTVTVMDGDETLGEVVADESGEWVFLPDQPLAPGNRELSLSAKTTGGQEIESENLVVLAVPERDAETGKLVDENPLAVLVPRDGGVTRVLQKPVEDEGVAALAGGLILDSIDYDDKGNVTISGRGANSATVRGYLDNGLLGNAKVENDGRWALSPTQVIEPGVYMLRLDQLLNNEVVSRLEIPFNRAAPLTDMAEGNFIIVQPGNSLWRIARRMLGQGTSYVEIYQANADQIRDPDLIYPGQVFQIPESNN